MTQLTKPGTGVGPALAAMALGGFALGTSEFASMGLLPDIGRALRITETETGHLTSAYAIGVVIGAPLLAGFGAKYPRRNLLLALIGIIFVGHLLTVLAPDYPTLMVARFVSGLPHGAYFGIASLMAASLVAPGKRGSAVASMMLGLTVANIIGVPVSTVIGQQFGWRAAFGLVAVIAAVTVFAVIRFVPQVAATAGAGMRSELGAFRRPQVLFALAIGSIGFGGMFAVYTYISPTLTTLSGFAEAQVPWALATFGLGMTAGTVVGGRLADRSVVAGIVTGLVLLIVTLSLFAVLVGSAVGALVMFFCIAFAGAVLSPALQMRLMDVAAGAQSLAAAMNHSALNLANAAGAWLGGLVIAHGLGYRAPAWVGVGLAILGLGITAVALFQGRRTTRAEALSSGAPSMPPAPITASIQ